MNPIILFQNQEGKVALLKDVIFTDIKYLYDNLFEKENIVSLWLRTDKDKWLKIVIDGKNCEINEYMYDESTCNLPENYSVVDYSNWIKGAQIVNAQVEYTELPEITLTIDLSKNKKLVFACNQDKNCLIKFLSTDD